LRTRLITLAVVATAVLVAAPLSSTAVGTDSTALRTAVTVPGMQAHLNAFQGFANASGGTRVDGTPGFENSVSYVAAQAAAAGLQVRVQRFTFDRWIETAPPVFQRTAPTPRTYVVGTEFNSMEYSGNGDVTAAIVPTNDINIPSTGGSTSGCEAADFPAAVAGKIALVQRGTCTFRQKADNAAAAGAIGVVIFNEGNSPDRMDVINGTLGAPQASLPVIDTTFANGKELYETPGAVVHIAVSAITVTTSSANVLADTPGGRADRVVVVGGHLDSVEAGPGINDNGSGSASILEIAKQMQAAGTKPVNKVRFAWWGGEEFGLLGAEHYVSTLSRTELKTIMLNLNFDMVASPNFVRFVYDGDGSGTGTKGPNGSGVIEKVFTDYFSAQGLATAPTAFDGRSDYGPFIDRGIPAGGLFTGAEGIKTPEQAAVYGGVAGVAYDHCYHSACDTTSNINATALDQMSDAIAHAVLQFAMTTSAVNGTDKASDKARAATAEFVGSHRIR
jgi:Zn-dependent M28 family amino/carboxypeptidase